MPEPRLAGPSFFAQLTGLWATGLVAAAGSSGGSDDLGTVVIYLIWFGPPSAVAWAFVVLPMLRRAARRDLLTRYPAMAWRYASVGVVFGYLMLLFLAGPYLRGLADHAGALLQGGALGAVHGLVSAGALVAMARWGWTDGEEAVE